MSRVRYLRWIRLSAPVLLMLSMAGCFFEPRTPEPPSVGNEVKYLPQITSANVWANLETSLKNNHAPGWEDNVSSVEFIYIPDSDTANQFSGVFDRGTPGVWDWGREQEIAFINNLYNSGVTISATLREPGFSPPPDSGSEAIWDNVIYDLTVTNPADNSSVRYRGMATITFRLDSNFWYIYQWRDQQGESDPDSGQLLSTMGVLRGNFASKKSFDMLK